MLKGKIAIVTGAGSEKGIGQAIAFLASDEAAYITGEEIDINGGSHMD
ncbi:MAG: SDR family oxidoreductase [Desulfobacterales bacterium]|jgi:3-oxoacyl-[acyl-carrier protein] reductase